MCFPSQHCHQQTTKSCFPLEDDSMNQRDNPISPWFARFMVPQTSQKQVEKIHRFQALTRWCLKEQQGTYDWMLGRKWSDQWWVRINGFFHLLIWLVVSIPLKNIRQIGNLPQVGVKIQHIWNHHLVIYWRYIEVKKNTYLLTDWSPSTSNATTSCRIFSATFRVQNVVIHGAPYKWPKINGR